MSTRKKPPGKLGAAGRRPGRPDQQKAKPETMDEYLATVNGHQRAALEKLRKLIRSLVPSAEECLSYGLAAFRLNGRPLVAFGAAAHHCALYPMSSAIVEVYKDELQGYDTSKGTIRFQTDNPLPAALVRKLVNARLAESTSPGTRRAPQPNKKI